MLTAKALTKKYKGADKPALIDVDITVYDGEIFGLLGPNGAGKTTAISIMTTLLAPSSGSVYIDGINISRNKKQIRQIIGFVPQEIALYPSLTIKENLVYFARLYGLHGKNLRQKITWSLEFTGLENHADKRLDTVSGGIKRRTNLAAGILNSPRILFLDEPTVGIDAQSRNMIIERLLMLKNQTAMIYTTHYMEEAEILCSHLAILNEGRIQTQGTPRELIDKSSGAKNLGEVFLSLTGKDLRD